MICMRVQSDKPVQFRDGGQGWLHPLGECKVQFVPEPPRPKLDVMSLIEFWESDLKRKNNIKLALKIGVSVGALNSLGCVWTDQFRAWAFPMRDGNGNYTGIRLRSDTGFKWSVKNSRQGLFIPKVYNPSEYLIVCEGPTDTAAALTIGLFAVGRPHCSGGIEDLRVFCRWNKIRRVVVVADKDDAGLRGAEMLSRHLPIDSTILILPAKDMRDFVNQGGTEMMIQSLIKGAVWLTRQEKGQQ